MSAGSESGNPSLHGARAPMEPLVLELRYRLAGDAIGDALTLQRNLSALRDAKTYVQDCALSGEGSLSTRVSFDGEVLELSVEAHADVYLEPCEVTLRHAFATDEAVLVNGYQSWTDTTEKPAWSRMRGLRGVSSRLVERFALDGGGDYAIVDYSGKRGHQHGFTYATFRRGEGMVLVGSLDESNGFTLIKTDASQGTVQLQSGRHARVLPAGQTLLVGRYAITRGTVDECYDRWLKLAGITARPIKPLVGYTSWYRHYGDIDEHKLTNDLEGVASFFDDVPFSLDNVQKVFQIDDGFCKVGDWLDVDKLKFPYGLKAIAGRIAQAGFLPGLWLAPFVCERDSKLFRERPDWLLRDDEGSPVPTGSHWSGGFALDSRNVEVRSYVLDVLQTVTRDWGFGLLKLDFLYAACKMSHDGLNRGQLMADAVDLLREGAGENVLLLGCGVPLGSVFGKFDYCRIGCDVGLDWDDLPHMRMLHRERVSTKNSLANTYGRAPLNGRVFGNDPDVFFLRDDVRLSASQREELLLADAELGSVFLTSDDMGIWSNNAREHYLEALEIVVGKCSE